MNKTQTFITLLTNILNDSYKIKTISNRIVNVP